MDHANRLLNTTAAMVTGVYKYFSVAYISVNLFVNLCACKSICRSRAGHFHRRAATIVMSARLLYIHAVPRVFQFIYLYFIISHFHCTPNYYFTDEPFILYCSLVENIMRPYVLYMKSFKPNCVAQRILCVHSTVTINTSVSVTGYDEIS